MNRIGIVSLIVALLLLQASCQQIEHEVQRTATNMATQIIEQISSEISSRVDSAIDDARITISNWYQGTLSSIRGALPFTWSEADQKDNAEFADSAPASSTEGAGDDPAELEYSVFGEILDRSKMLDRALNWIRDEPLYSQSHLNSAMYQGKYRQDCSGFVTFAWGIEPGPNGGLTTTGLRSDLWSFPIDDVLQLRVGDILVTAEGVEDAHVLIFAGWADSENLVFVSYEQVAADVHIPRQLQIVLVDGQIYLPGESATGSVGAPGTGPYVARRSNQFK